jgi:ABC-type multidrug transport system fused ATPase/permease subunit
MDIKNNKILIAARFFKKAFRQYKFKIILLAVLGFLSSFLEGIGINAIIPFLGFVLGGGKGDDIVSRFIERMFGYFNISFNLKYLLVFICLLFIFKAIILVVCRYINIRIAVDYEEQTRGALFEKTVKADWRFLSKQKLGYLEMAIITDINYGAVLLHGVSNVIMILTSLIIYLTIAININFVITISVLTASMLIILISKPTIYKNRVLARETSMVMKKIANFINEHIIGMKTIKAMFIENEVAQAAKEYFRNLRNLKLKLGIVKSILASVTEPISIVFIAIVFAIYYLSPNFNFAALAAIVYLIYRIFMYTNNLQGQLQSITEAVPYLAAALNYRDAAVKNEEKNFGSDKFQFETALEIKNVSFAYEEKKILNNVSFSVNKREMVGLIGPSGAGKTTTADLVLRLLSPESGEILLDGKNINHTDIREWRENIGYVSQDLFLKNDTFENNIKFYDQSVSDEDMIKAAKTAFIYDVIQSTANGFQTTVGERGMNLSAGQRQRVVLARVLARKPHLLILDEATSALDNESEMKIQQAIGNLKGETTVLAIAHRLSTIMNCDRIISLENGIIIEQGAPEELLKNEESYFYKVYNIRNAGK